MLSLALKSFSSEWHYQSFTFCDLPKLKYGLVQKRGGPCGIMASVQACLLQELLFANKHKPTLRYLEPNREERSRVLASALSTILWICGSDRKAVVMLPGMQAYFTNSNKI
ncbi:hypothetical protein LSH36_76g00069 [Paralvinella palmiformis]|uniref:Ubiquitin carboxyl-terminal hydrolase MINDY n=1 Tax=Paralvinella palmiformis TaxID=53620 RepID=A0AAD9K293_9ANNE|nr:hypothetical protein LSH36_76g00069 [Paralvinella palmiformis]